MGLGVGDRQGFDESVSYAEFEGISIVLERQLDRVVLISNASWHEYILKTPSLLFCLGTLI